MPFMMKWSNMKKIRLVIECVVDDSDDLSWVAQNMWDSFNRGEDITGWHTELLESNVEPLVENWDL